MNQRDPHEVLGVPRCAEFCEIKKAYKKLAAQLHPDMEGGSSERFREITEAFNALKNAQSLTGDTPEFIDEALTASVELTLEEMVFGCSKRVEVQIDSMRCKACSGSGRTPGSPLMPCISCMGTGTVHGVWGFNNSRRTCPTCKGSGTVPAQVCTVCFGKGKVKGATEINVNIPAGVENGQEIVFAGGMGRNLMGQLYLKIVGIPHQKYGRCGDDLTTFHSISVLDAMKGCKISVVSLGGQTVDAMVPPGTQSGDCVSIRGFGVKNSQTGRIGDLIVSIHVAIPKKLSARAMRLIEELEHEFKKQ